MKKTIFISLVVLVVAAAAFMYRDIQKGKTFTPVRDFAKDDEDLYQVMRNDLQSYLVKNNQTYGGWMDDAARANYDTGSYTIDGNPSRAAAYAAAVAIYYPQKKSRYSQLVTNLTNLYS
jgi:hypothetical protein